MQDFFASHGIWVNEDIDLNTAMMRLMTGEYCDIWTREQFDRLQHRYRFHIPIMIR